MVELHTYTVEDTGSSPVRGINLNFFYIYSFSFDKIQKKIYYI
jgi:hypothetical protein